MNATDEYWSNLQKTLSRRTLYIDTGAILGYLEKDNDKFHDFFDKSTGYRFITSTYVITETVRRLVKSQTPNQFVGPNGERLRDLSLFVLNNWIEEMNIQVIHLPVEVFEEAKQHYCSKAYIPCDLTDVISYWIVSHLGQDRIVAADKHFYTLGLNLEP